MILISHRGNLRGRIPDLENTISSIIEAILSGYYVEIDIWYIDGWFWLGHDKPVTPIHGMFLAHERVICHAKNLDAVSELKNVGAHWFWHENDLMTVTSRGWLWFHPMVGYRSDGVVLDFGVNIRKDSSVFAICADWLE